MILPSELGKKVLEGLREDNKPLDVVKESWYEGRSTDWTNWLVGHKKSPTPGVLEGIAKTLGYKTVEYEWFRTDQYWYGGMEENNWDWDDGWSDKGSVAVEHENGMSSSSIFYNIRKLCNLAVPFKLFIGYQAEPEKLLSTIEQLVQEREHVNGANYVVVFGWLRNDQLEWQGWVGTFEDKKFQLTLL